MEGCQDRPQRAVPEGVPKAHLQAGRCLHRVSAWARLLAGESVGPLPWWSGVPGRGLQGPAGRGEVRGRAGAPVLRHGRYHPRHRPELLRRPRRHAPRARRRPQQGAAGRAAAAGGQHAHRRDAAPGAPGAELQARAQHGPGQAHEEVPAEGLHRVPSVDRARWLPGGFAAAVSSGRLGPAGIHRPSLFEAEGCGGKCRRRSARGRHGRPGDEHLVPLCQAAAAVEVAAWQGWHPCAAGQVDECSCQGVLGNLP
mmetsp:Transcript_4209/g.11180  ORF Transcript_4209/g.11180 Transcript_4209/m.11180 type:complete len:254 (-) Transcript_4209:212-973(-)